MNKPWDNESIKQLMEEIHKAVIRSCPELFHEKE